MKTKLTLLILVVVLSAPAADVPLYLAPRETLEALAAKMDADVELNTALANADPITASYFSGRADQSRDNSALVRELITMGGWPTTRTAPRARVGADDGTQVTFPPTYGLSSGPSSPSVQ